MKYNQLLSSLKDPLLQSRFRLRLPKEEYRFQAIAESVEFSTRNVPAKQRFAMGKMFQFPDMSQLEGLSVVFYETFDFSVYRYLSKWDNEVRTSDGVYGMPIDYQRNMIIDFLGYEDDSVIQSFEYSGCWPTETAAISVNYEDSTGRVQINQQFAVGELL